MKKTYKNVKRTTTASGCNKNNRYKNNPYEKISFSHLGQQNLKNNKGRSPAQSKARDVIRKYKMQLRKLEFKRLKKLVPSMQNTSDEESNEVQILMEAVSYIDQLHHKLLHQIHSVGLPPQLIKESQKTSQRNHQTHYQMNMDDLKQLLGQTLMKKMKIKS